MGLLSPTSLPSAVPVGGPPLSCLPRHSSQTGEPTCMMVDLVHIIVNNLLIVTPTIADLV